LRKWERGNRGQSVLECLLEASNPLVLLSTTELPTIESFVKQRRKFTVLIERDEEGYYVATVPSLHGCHTQAKNLDTLMKRVDEVVELCLEENRSSAQFFAMLNFLSQIY
jgi:predicted RNase H-like HicB family nuclease